MENLIDYTLLRNGDIFKTKNGDIYIAIEDYDETQNYIKAICDKNERYFIYPWEEKSNLNKEGYEYPMNYVMGIEFSKMDNFVPVLRNLVDEAFMEQ